MTDHRIDATHYDRGRIAAVLECECGWTIKIERKSRSVEDIAELVGFALSEHKPKTEKTE